MLPPLRQHQARVGPRGEWLGGRVSFWGPFQFCFGIISRGRVSLEGTLQDTRCRNLECNPTQRPSTPKRSLECPKECTAESTSPDLDAAGKTSMHNMSARIWWGDVQLVEFLMEWPSTGLLDRLFRPVNQQTLIVFLQPGSPGLVKLLDLELPLAFDRGSQPDVLQQACLWHETWRSLKVV